MIKLNNLNIGKCVSVLNNRSDVCPMKINPPEIMVKRAGATARYINVMIALDCIVKLPSRSRVLLGPKQKCDNTPRK